MSILTLTNEYRTIGPPGCGKTTWVQRQLELACEKGLEPMVVSLTKAAAAEITGRDLPVPAHRTGTLHSQCYFALGRPDIAETKDHLPSWNETHPEYRLTGMEDLDGEGAEAPGAGPGDSMMTKYQTCRARMDPAENYPEDVKEFAKTWQGWKAESGVLDFTDLIQRCIDELPDPPEGVDVIFADEAQDMNHLEMALLRSWAEKLRMLVIVGDPDQCLYGWRGSDPSAFLHGTIEQSHRRVLNRSYRVPKAVHAVANRWIAQAPGREPVRYHPAEIDGEVRRVRSDWQRPKAAVQDMTRYLEQGKSVMLIASCSYMLQELIAEIRSRGIPYHNPQRPKNGLWNPLQRRESNNSATDRLMSWLKLSQTGERWNAEDVRRFASSMRLREAFQGSRVQAALDSLVEDDLEDPDNISLTWDQIRGLVKDDGLEAALTADFGWYLTAQNGEGRKTAEYPTQVARVQGQHALMEKPLVTVGTIHSVKGGEADVVYVFPDISRATAQEWEQGGEPKAAVHRVFYVAMTRAKESLIFCQPAANGQHVAIR